MSFKIIILFTLLLTINLIECSIFNFTSCNGIEGKPMDNFNPTKVIKSTLSPILSILNSQIKISNFSSLESGIIMHHLLIMTILKLTV